jgi:pantothenate kinase
MQNRQIETALERLDICPRLMTDLKNYPPIPEALQQRVDRLLESGRRCLLGLVGAPGAGKSTLAAALQQQLGELAQVVPMDGFHLANVELQRLGLAGRKGAPETFDSAGYVALLRRLRDQQPHERIYAPEFLRELEEPIAGAIGVDAQTRLVITEGNYLLLEQGHWAEVAGLLDAVWYVEPDEPLRLQRLLQRHMAFGRSEQAARDWIASTDEPNARLIEASRPRADRVLHWND